MDEKSNSASSPLASYSEHHFSKAFSSSISTRQKSAPPTSSGGSSSKKDLTRTVYNTLIAYRDTICTKGVSSDYCSKVYSSDSDISIFQQECERPIYPRSRPGTTSTVSSDTNCLSRETSQSSVRNASRYQRSRNSRNHRHQQESVSDVEEDEFGEATCRMVNHNNIINVLFVELQSTSSQDEDCTSWKWDTSKTKLWNEDTQRKHGSS